MTIEERHFLDEMLRALRAEMADVRRDILGIGLRLTGLEQQLAGLGTHVIALQHSVDGLSSDMLRVKQRLELVDGAA